MEKQLTFGEKLVGLHFNPANDDKVSQAKRLFADAADLLEKEYRAHNMAGDPFADRLFNNAVGELLNAQMNVVKVLTLNK
jgi:hypothetical protein